LQSKPATPKITAPFTNVFLSFFAMQYLFVRHLVIAPETFFFVLIRVS